MLKINKKLTFPTQTKNSRCKWYKNCHSKQTKGVKCNLIHILTLIIYS